MPITTNPNCQRTNRTPRSQPFGIPNAEIAVLRRLMDGGQTHRLGSANVNTPASPNPRLNLALGHFPQLLSPLRFDSASCEVHLTAKGPNILAPPTPVKGGGCVFCDFAASRASPTPKWRSEARPTNNVPRNDPNEAFAIRSVDSSLDRSDLIIRIRRPPATLFLFQTLSNRRQTPASRPCLSLFCRGSSPPPVAAVEMPNSIDKHSNRTLPGGIVIPGHTKRP